MLFRRRVDIIPFFPLPTLLVVLLLLLSQQLPNTIAITVPGCPSVRFRPPVGVENGPTCFCDTVDDDTGQIDISCTLGAKTRDVVRAYQRVANTTGVRAVSHFFNTDVNFREEIPRGFMEAGPPVKQLTIQSCEDRVFMHDDAFAGQEANIEAFTLSRCYFTDDNDPSMGIHPAVSKLGNLKNLTYQGTNLFRLNSSMFQNMRQLERLDLVANLIDNIDNETFEPLGTSLIDLDISRNFYLKGVSLLEHLRPLKKLEVLLANEVEVEELVPYQLDQLKELKMLALTRNSFFEIPANTFAGLENLDILSLRTNLLNRTSPGAFNGLTRLRKLYLGANYITDLNASSFIGMPNLEFLELAFNDMVVLQPSTFQPLKNLALLDLNGCKKLDNLTDSRVFQGLTSLETLVLTATGIQNISQNPFQHLKMLKTLNLGSNVYVTELGTETFEGLENLKTLYLNYTALDNLPRGIFDPLDHIEYLDLSGNSWYCDEDLAWMVKWLHGRLNDPNHPLALLNWRNTLCSQPEELHRFYVHNLDTSFLLARGANYTTDLEGNVTLPTTEAEPTEPPVETTTRSAFALDANDILSVKDGSDTGAGTGLASKVIVGAVGALLITTVAALAYVVVKQLKADRIARQEESQSTQMQ